MLEIGFGASTDRIQWLRAGALVSGIDLTEEALENVRYRINTYGLPAPESLQVADAEKLLYQSDAFDLGDSFGVLHHTPDTEKPVREMVRVVRPGGHLKIMLYNRYSIYVINRWVRFRLLMGRPWRTLRWVLWNTVESIGTKGYTRAELLKLLAVLPLRNVEIHTQITSANYWSSSALPLLNWLYRRALQLAGYHYGWRKSDYVPRVNDSGKPVYAARANLRQTRQPILAGDPIGFFHCIFAEEKG